MGARRHPRGGRPGTTRQIRGIVTDVDGTLTDSARRLIPEAMAALRSLDSHGIPVVLATGNVLPIALAVHRSIGLSAPIVAENGGLIYTRTDGVDRVERLAHRSVALAGYRRLRAAGIPVRRLFTDRWRETEVGLEPTVAEATIRRHLKGTNVRAEGTGFAIHLMERGYGKLPALRRVLATLRLTPGDCLIAGDGDNDVRMLRAAGYAVSFRGASPRAIRSADYVASEANAGGFVEALKECGVLARAVSTERNR